VTLLPIKHPEGGTMLVPAQAIVQVTRTLPSGRIHTDDVPADGLSDYLARRPDGRAWQFRGRDVEIRMRGVG
jgi:hypothetical protein